MKKCKVRGPGWHPWVYSGKVAECDARPGEAVEVYNMSGRFLGSALWNPNSGIALRFYSRQARPFDYEFIKERLFYADKLRKRLYPGSSVYRLAYAESDWLPGLVVDRYGEGFVFQVNSLGVELRVQDVVQAIVDLFEPAFVYELSDTNSRRREGLEPRRQLWHGSITEDFSVELEGMRLRVDPEAGKTGLYLDQRLNWARVAKHLRGTVIDAFSFTGAFGIKALLGGGVQRVYFLEQSPRALELLRENLQLNGISLKKAVFAQTDAFEAFEDLAQAYLKFDGVVLDPPNLAPHRERVPAALRAFERLVEGYAKLLKEGGVLAVFSCSNHVKTDDLLTAISKGLARAGRRMLVVEELTQAPCHPVPPEFPEARYLKGFVLVEA